MFGYRLLRESDYDALVADLKAARAVSDALNAQLLATTAEKASAKTMYEALIARVNVLELENASYRSKTTGLPTVAPQIAKGNPIAGSAIGAGVDLFSDVGDDKADELRKQGLLNEDTDALELPTAAAMSSGLAGG